MKRIDFENGKITSNILNAAIPMLIAQILSLLYNIVDRIYIARIPKIGTTALGAVGLCFPIIIIITAFSNLFGSGGAPIFSIKRGMKENEKAAIIMNTSFSMLCFGGIILMAVGILLAKPILYLFGVDDFEFSYRQICIILVAFIFQVFYYKIFKVKGNAKIALIWYFITIINQLYLIFLIAENVLNGKSIFSLIIGFAYLMIINCFIAFELLESRGNKNEITN